MKQKADPDDLIKKRRQNQKRYQKGEKIAFAGIASSVVLDPALGLPIGLYGAGKMLVPKLRQNAIERELVRNPKLAREVAERAAKTEFAAYFEGLAKKAEGKVIKRREKLKANAQRAKYRQWLAPRSKILQKVMERKADLARAGRQWEKRNERIMKEIAWDRKVMRAERRTKKFLGGMAAKARNILRRRKKLP